MSFTVQDDAQDITLHLVVLLLRLFLAVQVSQTFRVFDDLTTLYWIFWMCLPCLGGGRP